MSQPAWMTWRQQQQQQGPAAGRGGKGGREPPQERGGPFQPAFGTLLDHYLAAVGLWEACFASQAGLRANIGFLRAKLEVIMMFSGVPEERLAELHIPEVDDLVKEIEKTPENQARMHAALAPAKNKNDEEEILLKFKDEFTFEAVTRVLKQLKVALGEWGILHESMAVVNEEHGLKWFEFK